MRLGKEKAAGYVEDTEASVPEDVFIPDTERKPVTPELQQPVTAG